MPVTPSEREEEYFARQEFERRKKALTKPEGRGAEAERQRIPAVARNRCPTCATPLVTITYHKIKLDKLLALRDLVWLARERGVPRLRNAKPPRPI